MYLTARSPNLNDATLVLVTEGKLETVTHQVDTLGNNAPLLSEETVERVLLCESEPKTLTDNAKTAFRPSAKVYVLSEDSIWFWAIVGLTFSTVIAALGLQDDSFPMVYVRYVLGVLDVLFLPGYAAQRAFLTTKKLQYLEQLVLSVGLSILMTLALGLVLNYLPWGITLSPIVLGLAIITLFFAFVAIQRTKK